MSPADPGEQHHRTCAHCGYIVDFLSSERCPECGTRLDAPAKRAAPACVLLLGLTIANALLGLASAVYRPPGSNWSAARLAWNVVWKAAGIGGGVMVVAWIIVLLAGWRLRADPALRWGFAIAIVHLLAYALTALLL